MTAEGHGRTARGIAASRRGTVRLAVTLRRVGLAVTLLSAIFFAALVTGGTVYYTGGWQAAGLVAAWAVPLAGLIALSWFRPGWAIAAFWGLTAAVTGVSAWFALDPQAWRAFEDRYGPVRAVITFVLATAISPLGLKRTAAAGILLLAVGIVPVAVSGLGSFLGFASLSFVSAAPVITGTLYLLSARLGHASHRHERNLPSRHRCLPRSWQILTIHHVLRNSRRRTSLECGAFVDHLDVHVHNRHPSAITRQAYWYYNSEAVAWWLRVA